MSARSPRTKKALEQKTVVELKAILKSHQLSPTGVKAELIKRLMKNKIYALNLNPLPEKSKRSSLVGAGAPTPVSAPIPVSVPVMPVIQSARQIMRRDGQMNLERNFYIDSLVFEDSEEYDQNFVSNPDDTFRIPAVMEEITFTFPHFGTLYHLLVDDENQEEDYDDDEETYFKGPMLEPEDLPMLEVPIGVPELYIRLNWNLNTSTGVFRDTLMLIRAEPGRALVWLNVLTAAGYFYDKLQAPPQTAEYDYTSFVGRYNGIPVVQLMYM